MKWFAIAIGALACSCGGVTTTTTPGQSPTCTVTVSGAVSGTFDCKPATTGWASSNNTGAFGFNVQNSGGTNVTVAIGWSGEPQTGTHYKNTDATSKGGVAVFTGSGASTQVWLACANDSSGNSSCHNGTTVGSYDLVFTSVSNSITESSGKAYTTDGTITATLQPQTGQSGTVTINVTF